MNFLCPLCAKQSSMGQFRLEGERLWVRCEHCLQESTPPAAPPEAPVIRIHPERPAPERNLFHPPPGHCPKCVAPRAQELEACPRCGLVFAHFDPDALRPAAWLVEEWNALAADWSNLSKHRALIERAHPQEALGAVARLYRIYQAWSPPAERTPEAPAALGLEWVTRQAMVQWPKPQTASTSPRAKRALPLWVLAVLVALGLGIVFSLLRLWAEGP